MNWRVSSLVSWLFTASFQAAQADPAYFAPPPPVVISAPSAPAEHPSVFHAQAAPAQYSIGQPSNQAQYLLQLLNRSRANAVAEATRIVTDYGNSTTTLDANITGAAQYFGVNFSTFQSQFATLPSPEPPLAFNPLLLQASLLHSEDMQQANFQGHNNSVYQPGNQTVNVGDSTSFLCNAVGTPAPSLQWQISTDGGSTWSNISATATYGQVTTDTLIINNITADMNGDQFRLLAFNSAGTTPSTPGILSVNEAAADKVAIKSLPSTSVGTAAKFSAPSAVTADDTAVAPSFIPPPGNLTPGGDLGSRLTAVGYDFSTAAENVFAYGEDLDYVHASFEIDWGNFSQNVDGVTFPSIGGMQNPPGHRYNNHDLVFNGGDDPDNTTVTIRREIGISVVAGAGNGNGAVTGPLVVTYDFGTVQNDTPLITGVVYLDANDNNFYDPGEGIGNVTVTVSNANFYAVTAGSGGYAVPVPSDGTYTISFTGGGVANFTENVTVSGGNNVEADYMISAANLAPNITTQPASTSAAVGAPISFTVIANGSSLTYQWQFNNKPISGATSATYAISKVAATNAGNYTVIVTNTHGSVPSLPATLTIGVPPSISSGPASLTVTGGGNATFSVGTTGTQPITIYWQISTNGGSTWSNITALTPGNFTGFNSSNLTVGDTSASQSTDQFRALAVNLVGEFFYTATSKAATLTVNAPPTLTSLMASSGNQSVNSLAGGNLSATAGSLVTFSASAVGGTVKYQWQLNGKNISGATKATYTISKAAAANTGAYTVLISNSVVKTPIASSAINLTVLVPPSITTQPKAQSVKAAGTANFVVKATASPPITAYQWTQNGQSLSNGVFSGVNVSGATSASLTLGNVTTALNGDTYLVKVTNSSGTTPSASVKLTVK